MLEAISFCAIGQTVSSIDQSRTLIVTDKRIQSLFGSAFPNCAVALVPEGESAKSWETLLELYGRCVALGVDRSWGILAIGGGTVSDIAGFLAHTWMRGIRFSVVPTTLLAMTDAALGGKNGIDFEGYKNLVGSFHLPDAIFCDIETLRTLDATQFASGMAEVIKHAIIDGEGYFSFLEKALATNCGEGYFDVGSCPAALLWRMVAESQRVKLSIVERDPKESGERRILNLGHSFGHAVEIVSGLPHGHAVSIGMALACSFSTLRHGMKPEVAERIGHLLAGYGLPIDAGALRLASKKVFWRRVKEALFMDKKREGGYMSLVIPQNIGAVKVEKIEMAEIEAFLDKVSP